MVAIEGPGAAEADRERLPGDFDVWVFVFADLASFAFYFVVYMIYRVQHPALCLAEQQHLDVFAALKTVEWYREISRGYTLPRNEFWMFYFALTGVHLFHVLIGLVVLAALVRELRHRELRRQAWLESGALYWHMVDLVWVFVFATLYLMR
jgi:nitric oxide reductase NorE protein